MESLQNHQPRYVINIMFNQEGIYLSQRTQPGKVMYGLWQVPGGKVEDKETSLEAVLRETQEETGIKLNENQTLLIFNDPEFDCDVYFTYYCGIPLQWTEQNKQGPWIIVTIDDYIRMASMNKTTPTHTTCLWYIVGWIYKGLGELDIPIENL